MFKMVKKMQNSGFEIVAGLSRPLRADALRNVSKVNILGETGDGSYTSELLQSSLCQAGTREDSLTNINL